MSTALIPAMRVCRYVVSLGVAALMSPNAYAFAEQPVYLTKSDNDIVQFLPNPPALGSMAYRKDLCSVMTAQRDRTNAQIKTVAADKEVSVFRFSDVLGSDFTADKLPKTAALFSAALRDASVITARAKSTFARGRPFVSNAAVQPLFVFETDERHRSYPSGHATAGYLNAILLSKMLPEKRDALFARGKQYGDNRIIAGVHFPSDLEAGRLGASLVAAALFREPQFQRDFQAASEELQEVLRSAD